MVVKLKGFGVCLGTPLENLGIKPEDLKGVRVMSKKQIIWIIGGVLLIIGAFTPVMLGFWGNYYSMVQIFGQIGDLMDSPFALSLVISGIILLGLGIVSVILSLAKSYKACWSIGIVSIVLALYIAIGMAKVFNAGQACYLVGSVLEVVAAATKE